MPIYFYLRKAIASLGFICHYICANPIETWGCVMKISLILALRNVPTKQLPFTLGLHIYQLK